ncbi:MAG TPA: hypothetical protein PKM73_10300 [Verrucomicrobiota bacterium]|nr:hypothetical protein [Verrucomicrobiota bacterium]HNU51059.1 hypothetical protein [Verrucomicrobiota bacterium]
MNQKLTRRTFLARTVVGSAAATAAAHAADPATAPAGPPSATAASGTLPHGKLGRLTVSRLISGGNLISGWAHSRDLHYVPSLMRAYNTEAKVLETLARLESQGVNTIIADPAKKPMDLFARHWKQGGKIQWIAEGHPEINDWKTDIQRSIDFGAAAVYVQGVIGDQWYKSGHLDLLGRCVELVRRQGLPAGIGAHKLEVILESEKDNLGAEFYVKTLHPVNYWSTRRPDQTLDVVDNPADNYWDLDPERTIRAMLAITKPWIAFKTLAAGAIRPEAGFRYAFENGADFICVGMFDFQVDANARLVRTLLASPEIQNRPREWWA